jgi:hypothetical protein
MNTSEVMKDEGDDDSIANVCLAVIRNMYQQVSKFANHVFNSYDYI